MARSLRRRVKRPRKYRDSGSFVVPKNVTRTLRNVAVGRSTLPVPTLPKGRVQSWKTRVKNWRGTAIWNADIPDMRPFLLPDGTERLAVPDQGIASTSGTAPRRVGRARERRRRRSSSNVSPVTRRARDRNIEVGSRASSSLDLSLRSSPVLRSRSKSISVPTSDTEIYNLSQVGSRRSGELYPASISPEVSLRSISQSRYTPPSVFRRSVGRSSPEVGAVQPLSSRQSSSSRSTIPLSVHSRSQRALSRAQSERVPSAPPSVQSRAPSRPASSRVSSVSGSIRSRRVRSDFQPIPDYNLVINPNNYTRNTLKRVYVQPRTYRRNPVEVRYRANGKPIFVFRRRTTYTKIPSSFFPSVNRPQSIPMRGAIKSKNKLLKRLVALRQLIDFSSNNPNRFNNRELRGISSEFSRTKQKYDTYDYRDSIGRSRYSAIQARFRL